MELNHEVVQAYAQYDGHDVRELEAGRRLRIRVTGGAVIEILDVTVPEGKVWDVLITVKVEERDEG